MPSSATITSFYNFSANTKARASQVNNNFDVFRGHIIPVDPNTATSANNTYDLGSNSYLWANIYGTNQYLNDRLLFGLTTTKQAIIKIDGETTSAEVITYINGTEKCRVNTNGIVSSNFYGFLANPTGYTSTAGKGYVAISSTITALGATTTATDIIGSTLTISTNGRPILIGLKGNTTAESGNRFQYEVNSPADRVFIGLYRNNSLIDLKTYTGAGAGTTGAGIIQAALPEPFIDVVTVGTYNYHLKYYAGSTASSMNFALRYVNLYAVEL